MKIYQLKEHDAQQIWITGGAIEPRVNVPYIFREFSELCPLYFSWDNRATPSNKEIELPSDALFNLSFPRGEVMTARRCELENGVFVDAFGEIMTKRTPENASDVIELVAERKATGKRAALDEAREIVDAAEKSGAIDYRQKMSLDATIDAEIGECATDYDEKLNAYVKALEAAENPNDVEILKEEFIKQFKTTDAEYAPAMDDAWSLRDLRVYQLAYERDRKAKKTTETAAEETNDKPIEEAPTAAREIITVNLEEYGDERKFEPQPGTPYIFRGNAPDFPIVFELDGEHVVACEGCALDKYDCSQIRCASHDAGSMHARPLNEQDAPTAPIISESGNRYAPGTPEGNIKYFELCWDQFRRELQTNTSKKIIGNSLVKILKRAEEKKAQGVDVDAAIETAKRLAEERLAEVEAMPQKPKKKRTRKSKTETASPAEAEETTPRSEEPTQRPEETTPRSEEPTRRPEETTPQSKEATQEPEEATPRSEEATQEPEEATPRSEEPTPRSVEMTAEQIRDQIKRNEWEAVLLEMSKQARRADEAAERAKEQAKSARKLAQQIRARMQEILELGSAKYQSATPLFNGIEETDE